MALTLTGATNRVPDRNTATRALSPVALTLTGATNRVPDLNTAIRALYPAALMLTEATNRIPDRSPDKARSAAIRGLHSHPARFAGDVIHLV